MAAPLPTLESSRVQSSRPPFTSFTPLTEFELFPKLPRELRLKIFELIPKARTVEIMFYKGTGRSLRHRLVAYMPPVLHICRESRYESLEMVKTQSRQCRIQ